MEERELDRETDYVVVINPQKWREGHIVVSIHRERERERKRERKRERYSTYCNRNVNIIMTINSFRKGGG